ncbi:9192_t:CDS:2, partial [Entrophospora sp. SA101]
MSRSQFIRNTMSTVHAQANLSAQNNNSVRGSYEDDCNSLLSLSSYKQGNNALALQRSISKISRPNTRLAALKKGIASNISSKENNSHHSNKDSSKNTKLSPSPSFASGSSGDMNNSRNSLYRSNSSQTLPTTLSSFSLRHASSSETVFTSTIAESADEVSDSVSTNESLELYLSGAPYAKEGLLFRKHFWESSNKRSKDKNWKE